MNITFFSADFFYSIFSFLIKDSKYFFYLNIIRIHK